MTTPAEIKEWFDRGIAQKATHLIVVCDDFDHEDYPVFVDPGEDFYEKHDQYANGKNMQRVMEVYDLSKPWPRLKSRTSRVLDYPPRKTPSGGGNHGT